MSCLNTGLKIERSEIAGTTFHVCTYITSTQNAIITHSENVMVYLGSNLVMLPIAIQFNPISQLLTETPLCVIW